MSEERANYRRRVALVIAPFALRYKALAEAVYAELAMLTDEELREAKSLGSRVFHGDPEDAPFEVIEVGRVVEVQAAILLAQREFGRRPAR